MLFSLEFLEAVHARLSPAASTSSGSTPTGSANEQEPTALALRTFAPVFPHVSVWYGSGPSC